MNPKNTLILHHVSKLRGDLKIFVNSISAVQKQTGNPTMLFSFRVVLVSGALAATLSNLLPQNLLNVTATTLANWLTALLKM